MKSKLFHGASFLIVAFFALLVFSFAPIGFGQKTEVVEASATTGEQVSLYEEDFDDITTRVNLISGNNHFSSSAGGWIYAKKSTNGSAYVENGRMYFSGSAYDVIYRDGGQVWGNYTVEADMCYTVNTGWGGLLFNVQSDTKWQKGGISIGKKASINGYEGTAWTNNTAGTNTGFTISDTLSLNNPFRLKIAVENKTATLYYAIYTDGVLGEWKQVMTINNIPANAQTGSIGFLTSNGTNNFVSYWVDNIKCYSNSDVSFTEDFDSYGNVTLSTNQVGHAGTYTASVKDSVNYTLGLDYLVYGTAGTAQIVNGELVFTGGNSHDAILFTSTKNWTNYVYEADVTHLNSTQWNGLLVRSHSTTNFQKAGISLAATNNVSINGKYNSTNWYNNVSGITYKTLSVNVQQNVKFRMKVVAEEGSLDLYYANYDSNGNLGEWIFVMGHDDRVPDGQMSGMIGFMSNAKSQVAFDNVVVRRLSNRMTTPVHTYTLVEGTHDCETGGKLEHYTCSGCEKLFVLDGADYVEIDADDLTVSAGHDYKFVAQVDATQESEGVKEHYECKNCDKLFVEVGGIKTETTAQDLKIDKLPTETQYVLYEENFDGATTRINLKAGLNRSEDITDGWYYAAKSANGGAYIENGKMYFSGSAYDVIYRDGGHVWGNYTLEADMCYTVNTGWGGMLFNVQSEKTWQKGGVSLTGATSINGQVDGHWINDAQGVNKGFTVPTAPTLNEPFRLKIVVENKSATLYYALYNGTTLGQWVQAVSINNIPLQGQTGSIGFMTSNNALASYWIDNIKCYSNSDVSFTENFDSYGEVTLTANAVNAANGLNYLIPSGKNAGTAVVTGGQLVFTGGASHDIILFETSKNWTNYTLESDVTYINNAGWAGLAYRSHDATNFQKGAVAPANSSGKKRASLNGKFNGGWIDDVEGITKKDYDAGIELNVPLRMKIVVEENSVDLYYAHYDKTTGELGEWVFVMGHDDRLHSTQYTGMIGFMSNAQSKVAFDNIVVRRGSDRMTEIVAPAVAEIYEPESGIVNPPVVVQNMATSLPATTGERPAVLLTKLDANLNVLSSNGTVLTTIDSFINTYRNVLIPAFIIDSDAQANALANKIQEYNLIDCYVVATAQNAGLVKKVRLANNVTAKITGALIFDDLNGDQARKNARALVVDNMSFVAISNTSLDEETTRYFNARQIAVWSNGYNKADVYNAIACGYHGLITNDASFVYGCYKSVTAPTVSGKPIIIAHRGANNLIKDSAGNATVGYPENTMMSFKAAVEQYGADALETDVRISSDGYLFLLHDPQLDRTTNGTGNSANYTLAQLKALTVDEVPGKETKIPTFEELLQYVQGTDIVIYAHINVVTDVVMASFNHLIDKYGCRDNIIAFIPSGYREQYNSQVTTTASNPAYSLTNVPVVSSGTVYTAGDAPILTGLASVLDGVQAMRNHLNPCNYQPLFYRYDRDQGAMWGTESFYYQLSARGIINSHSITDSQGTMDNVALTGKGAVGFLTDCIDLCDDYHYIIDAQDESFCVGEYGSLTKSIKMTKGTVDLTCRLIVLDGDAITSADGKFTRTTAGTSTAIYFVTRKANGGTTYSIFSRPVTITFSEHSYTKHDEEPKTCTENGKKEHYSCDDCGKLYIKNGDVYTEVKDYDLVIGAGHTLIDVQAKDKTCTEDGYTAHQKCSVCGEEVGKTIIPAGHELVDVEGKDKTCTEDGYTAHQKCSVCGEEVGKTVIEAGHELVDVEGKDKTCTEDGYTTHQKCSVCGHEEGKTVLPAGHEMEDVEGKDKTCTEDGYTAHQKCSKCGEEVGKTVLPAGHELVDVEGKDKTCTEDGYTAHQKCSVCGHEEGKTVIEAGHEFEDVEGKDKTCTEDGYTAHQKCSVCGHEEGKTVIPASHEYIFNEEVAKDCETNGTKAHYTCEDCEKLFLLVDEEYVEVSADDLVIEAGHEMEDVEDKDKTCTEDGYTAHQKCSVCGEEVGKTVIPAGHEFEDVEGKDKTCTEDGYTAHQKCSVCGEEVGKTVIPAGHEMEDVEGKDKTCDEDGYTAHQKCSVCGHEEGKTVIEAGHEFVEVEGKDKTCTEDGYTAHQKCSVCGHEEGKTVLPAGHEMEDVEGKDKTCTEDGYTAHQKCYECGEEAGKTILEAGHELVDVKGKDKTCTEDGYTAYKACSECDYTEGKEVIKAGHDYVSVPAKGKTCTEDGYTLHLECEDCHETSGKVVIPAGHALFSVVAKDKTCTEDGYTSHKACSKCDYTEGKTVIEAGHELIDVEGKDKTCTEDGYSAHKACKDCYYTESKTVIEAGHELISVAAKDKTCTEDGYSAHQKCTECDHVEGKTVIAAGHDYEYVAEVPATVNVEGTKAHYKCKDCDKLFVEVGGVKTETTAAALAIEKLTAQNGGCASRAGDIVALVTMLCALAFVGKKIR